MKKTASNKTSTAKAKEVNKKPRVTKKSIVIDMVSKGKGATVEKMAEACTKAGLGDMERNLKTVKLWLPKLGFKVERNAKGCYKKSA